MSAARELHRSGLNVVVLEKSRGLSGRAATRTLHGNRVDHGAQYFTVRDEGFQAQVDEWLAQGSVQVWSHGFHALDESGLHRPDEGGHPRYICPDGMNRVGKLLAEELEVRRKTRVQTIKPEGDTWTLELESGETVEAKTVIVNTPAEQAEKLCNFELTSNVAEVLNGVAMEPCFAVMAGFEKHLAPTWKGITVELNGLLAWVAQDSSKRKDPKDLVLVLHSTPEYARENYEAPHEQVARDLLEALSQGDERYEPFTAPLWTDVQRWRYARATEPYEKKVLRQDGLYFCGDWCGGAKLEAAYLSGLATAQAILDAKI